ncbi:short chain dehydrogenase, partial [Pseudomonas aeruginosa]
MTDRYIAFANSPVGRRLVGAVGLPSPLRLELWQAGRVRPEDSPRVSDGGGPTDPCGLPLPFNPP